MAEAPTTGAYGSWQDIPNSAAGEANANSYMVLNRSNGTTYTYQVRAVNVLGESDPSNEDSATPAPIGAAVNPTALHRERRLDPQRRPPGAGSP